MITPGIKDQVLRYLLDTQKIGEINEVNVPELLGHIGIEFKEFETIVRMFEDDDFAESSGGDSNSFVLYISPAAHRFIFHSGGYSRKALASELEIRNMTLNVEYLELQLNQLHREIEDIRPTLPEKAERLFNILGNIAAVIGVTLKG